jgi:hypothetical protein
MKASTVTTIAVLILGAILITHMYITNSSSSYSPPGQYPINATRPQWPVTERVAYYRPGAAMGSDMVSFPGGSDAKGRCATSNTCAE